ncbi:MAG: transcriptional regulator, partial [Halodesulfurarchaeum sp.]
GADDVRDAESTPDDPDVDPEDEPIVAVLTRVGFEVHPTLRAPFNAVSEDREGTENLLTGHSALTDAAVKRARIMSSLGRVTRTRAVYFVDDAPRESIDNTAIIERDEATDVEDPDEFRDIIRERGETPEA